MYLDIHTVWEGAIGERLKILGHEAVGEVMEAGTGRIQKGESYCTAHRLGQQIAARIPDDQGSSGGWKFSNFKDGGC